MRWKIDLTGEFTRFIFVGGFAAGVNFLSRIAFDTFTTFRIAIVLAYITGMLTAFVLSKVFVFQPSIHRTRKEFFYFSLVNLVAIVQVWLISVGLAEYFFPRIGWVHYPEEISHIIGLMVPMLTSYYGHKYVSFRQT